MRAPSVAVVARSPLVAAVAVVAAVAASCAPAPLAIPAGCSPLYADHDCGLPYPSDFFTTDDATLPTGKRVHFADAAKLITDGGLSADVNDAWPADGFSRVTPIVWSFGVRTDPASVTGIFDDQAPTLQPGFHTALINARTGERVPHFIDVDPLAEADDREGLVMHPLVQLDERTRYVVAISGVKAKSGTLPVPEAFARMRDNNVGDDPVLKPLLARYETDVFAVTTKDGLDRKALQLAWDFTTGSDEHVMDDMLTARAVALASLAETPPVVTVDAVFEGSQAATILGAGAEDTFRLVRTPSPGRASSRATARGPSCTAAPTARSR